MKSAREREGEVVRKRGERECERERFGVISRRCDILSGSLWERGASIFDSGVERENLRSDIFVWPSFCHISPLRCPPAFTASCSVNRNTVLISHCTLHHTVNLSPLQSTEAAATPGP